MESKKLLFRKSKDHNDEKGGKIDHDRRLNLLFVRTTDFTVRIIKSSQLKIRCF